MDKPLTLAEKILLARHRLKEDQKAFGNRFGVSRYAVKDWERDATKPTRHLDKLREIFAQMLGDDEQGDYESVAYQLVLPFEEPLRLELRILPRNEKSVSLGILGRRRKAS